jgi:hypothetical protein
MADNNKVKGNTLDDVKDNDHNGAVAGLVAVSLDNSTETETDGKNSPIVGDDVKESYNDTDVNINSPDLDGSSKIKESYNELKNSPDLDGSSKIKDSYNDVETETEGSKSPIVGDDLKDSFNKYESSGDKSPIVGDDLKDSYNKYETTGEKSPIVGDDLKDSFNKDSFNDDSLDFKHISDSAGIAGLHDVLNGAGNDMSFNIGQINSLCDNDHLEKAKVSYDFDAGSFPLGEGEAYPNFNQENTGSATGGTNTSGENNVGHDGTAHGENYANAGVSQEAFTQNIVMGANTLFNSNDLSVAGNDHLEGLLPE